MYNYVCQHTAFQSETLADRVLRQKREENQRIDSSPEYRNGKLPSEHRLEKRPEPCALGWTHRKGGRGEIYTDIEGRCRAEGHDWAERQREREIDRETYREKGAV